MIPLLLAAALLQDPALKVERHDAWTVSYAQETTVESSDGRATAHSVAFQVAWTVESVEGGTIRLNGALRSVKASGKVRDQAFKYEWTKGGVPKSEGAAAAVFAPLHEKGFHLKVSTAGAVLGHEGLGDYLEQFPAWNPSALLGLAGPVTPAGKLTYDFALGFALEYVPGGAGAKRTAKLAFSKRADEDMAPRVSGEGTAEGGFDAAKGRPSGSGSGSLKVAVQQGGLKKDVAQACTFKVE